MRSKRSETRSAAFSRNPQLHSQYRSIGSSLLSYEERFFLVPTSVDENAYMDFRTGTSFIPNVVLDSYLEDLLDSDVSESDLWIRRAAFSWQSLLAALPWCGVLVAFAVGLFLTAHMVPLALSALITVLFCLPFGWLSTRVPRPMNRRMAFARLIAFELSQRRGSSEADTSTTRIQFKEILIPSLTRAAGASRVVLH